MPFKIKNVQFVFVRHGQAEPAKVGQQDRDRPLNEVGMKQAKRLEQRLINMVFDLALISPTQRNWQTAEIVLDGMRPEMTELNCLLVHPDKDVNAGIETMYAALNNSPFRAYLDHKKAAMSLRMFAGHAAREIEDEVALRANEATTFDVLVSGNSVLMNAIISEMFPTCAGNMLDFVFTECGAVKIAVDHHGNATFSVVN
ncbi:MAG: histidine phosphatase family protein [Candidatus Pacebacteria bacterium]|jgi:broad specificity phosphatase PhoE|nr:histidine phosphatase family protein [Candidatus Paceibacterota bacterium]